MNYKLTVSYNGSLYHGWGKQPHLLTIEQTIIDAFKKLFDLEVTLFVSGRTDAGVHALNQVFNVNHPTLNITGEKLAQALNSQLPQDIYIKHAVVVNSSFHARFSCQFKTYLYLININPIYDAINCKQILQYNKPLDLQRVQTASQLFVGRHNFLSFSTSELQNTIREIKSLEITTDRGLVQVKITGNGFLHNMVRMIIGSLLAYNENKLSLDDLKTYLQQPAKGRAMHKAPACGLYLMSVYYN